MDEIKQEVVVNQRKVIKLSKKKFMISLVVVVFLALIILFSVLGGSYYMIDDIMEAIVPIALGIAVIFFIWGLIQYFSTANPIIQQKARPKITGGIIGAIIIVVLWAVLSLLTQSFSVGPERLSMNDMAYAPINEVNISTEKINSFVDSSDYYRGQSQSQTINDTREFLKTSYNSTIKTREVSDVVKDARNIVKGYDGRVDSYNSNEKYGYVKFVVAKSKFEDFRDEIEALTHKKLYTENISAENLLAQKQGIEEQTENIVNTLGSLQNQLATLNSTHAKTVSIINAEITRLKNELTSLRLVISKTIDPLVLAPLRTQENTLLNQETYQKQLLNKENQNYAIQKQNLENSINNANNGLANVVKEDIQFTDNIETVNGYINVNWVSLWQMARIFSPIPPLLIVFVLLVLIGIYLSRSKHVPKIQFE